MVKEELEKMSYEDYKKLIQNHFVTGSTIKQFQIRDIHKYSDCMYIVHEFNQKLIDNTFSNNLLVKGDYIEEYSIFGNIKKRECQLSYYLTKIII